MSQVARVFVVLNLLLAAGFLFSASTFLALNNDYKGQLAEKEVELDQAKKDHLAAKQDLQSKIDDAENKLSESNAQKQAATLQLEAVRRDLGNARTENEQKQQTITGLTQRLDNLQKAVTRSQDFVEKLTTETDDMKDKMLAAQKSEREALSSLETQRERTRELENTVADKERTIASQGTQIEDLELFKSVAISKGVTPENILIQKPVQAAVSNSSGDLVIINKGKNAGVERGYVFDIVRGGRYIGRCEIDKVHATHASGIMKVKKAGERVMVGDRATTTLDG